MRRHHSGLAAVTVLLVFAPQAVGARQAALSSPPATRPAPPQPTFCPCPDPAPKPPEAPRSLAVRYVRDSEEYAALTRQVYRAATARVVEFVDGRTDWAVVMDIDETALDNSTYQLEREAYGLPFDDPSWAAWVKRAEAGPVPGGQDFVRKVRERHGRIAWISGRDSETAAVTERNLDSLGLWDPGDLLCLQHDGEPRKSERRGQVASGHGACSWPDAAMTTLLFVGDQMGDFPATGERVPTVCSDVEFGRTCFLLPQPMYGSWTKGVTRIRP